MSHPRNDYADADCETNSILKARIKPSTRGTYARGNIRFMMWLYDQSDDYHHLFQPNLLCTMTNTALDDARTLTKSGNPSKAQTNLCGVCRSSLFQIKPELEETHPIKLTTLDFQVFSRYLATLKKPSTRRSVVIKMALKTITSS